MAAKSANVMARVEPDIKEQAEAILSSIGITASAGINMFYRQIIVDNGLPFRPSASVRPPKALSEMAKEEFDAKMTLGLAQAKAGEGMPADEFFKQLDNDRIRG